MISFRVIPILLVSEGGLVKTVQFDDPTYIGDVINAVRIYNDSEVDEIIVLDIDASVEGRGPDFEMVKEVAGECFMPLCYGGGITESSQVRQLFRSGVEKVAINTALANGPALLKEVSGQFGAQAIVASIDVKRQGQSYSCFHRHGSTKSPLDLAKMLDTVQENGAGEVLLTSMDHEGRQIGYDLELVSYVRQRLSVPLIVNGGAGSLPDLLAGAKAGAAALGAGSLFVYQGKHKAVLVNYPSRKQMVELFSSIDVSG